MKKLFFAFLLTMSSLVNAQDMMTSSMILSNTVMLTTASAVEDDDPKQHADFYINDHRVVENTSISVQHIANTLLKAKNIKKDFENETLIVKYSYNQLSEKTYKILEQDSLQSFKEKTAYVTVDKIVYKDNKATVFITVLDKAHHSELIENHNSVINILLGIACFFGILMVLFMISL